MNNGDILIAASALLLIGLIVPIICIVKSIRFDQKCGGYLKQTADAITVELALNRINQALKYIEANNLCDGYTSVLWITEDDNVEYWYNNIKNCQKVLAESVDGTNTEKSNMLMKVHESLTDNGEYGMEVTLPSGISLYPNNGCFAVLLIISGIFLCCGILVYASCFKLL